MWKEIKAKPTKYNNTIFRSRLEVRWAIFFDELGIKWKYEPEYDDVEFGGCRIFYKPDFYLPDYDLWIEVKPSSIIHLSDGEIRKIVGWAKEYFEILVLSGPPRILIEDSKAHYLYTYNPQKKKVNRPQPYMRWCECPKCGKIDYRPGGGIPCSCDKTCYPEPAVDLFDEELPEPEGHKSQRLKNACNKANNHNFDVLSEKGSSNN
ncbi:MAG: hypothetical protein KKG47_17170 [Proteobacteria bacterium]|nr:hypothetical protein [Pseudomonadota bacterium]